MSYRTWGRGLLTALGAGLLAGTGQLGIAYGLGILRFAHTFPSPMADQWAAQLAWVGWFAMVAAVTGALIAERLVARHGHQVTMALRVALAGAAAVGAAGIAPLAMAPARAVQVTSVAPVLAAAVAAGLGAVAGLLAALAALRARPIGWNIAAVTGGIWFLALLSVLPSLAPGDPLPSVRLGVLDPAWLDGDIAHRLAVVAMPALALIAGAATGALARQCGHPRSVVATCGIIGPALLALAYLTAGPGGSADRYQATPYWGALVAAGSGLLGSVLAAVIHRPYHGNEDSQPSISEPTEAAAPVTTELGPADPGPAEPSSAATPPVKSSRRRAAKARARAGRPVPAPDEEYVDWVSGLSVSGPLDAEPPLDPDTRRSLRSSGRHQVD